MEDLKRIIPTWESEDDHIRRQVQLRRYEQGQVPETVNEGKMRELVAAWEEERRKVTGPLRGEWDGVPDEPEAIIAAKEKVFLDLEEIEQDVCSNRVLLDYKTYVSQLALISYDMSRILISLGQPEFDHAEYRFGQAVKYAEKAYELTNDEKFRTIAQDSKKQEEELHYLNTYARY